MGDNAVPHLDTSVPHPARIYDFFLGGKDNYVPDREAGEQIIARFPDTRVVARQNRDFMRRAARVMAAEGIRQFLDLGSGLPTADNLHEVAQREAPGSRVVYVDNDPLVLAHGRALLVQDEHTTVITADLRDPDAVFAQALDSGLIDLGDPLGVMMVAVLHFVPDTADLTGLLGAYLDRLVPGSHLALSHVTDDGLAADLAQQATGTYQATASGLHFRSTRQIEALFDGMRLLEPGVVPTWQWRPELGENEDRPTSPIVLAGVGQL